MSPAETYEDFTNRAAELRRMAANASPWAAKLLCDLAAHYERLLLQIRHLH